MSGYVASTMAYRLGQGDLIVDMPAGVEAGDALYAVIMAFKTGTTTLSVSTPAGWAGDVALVEEVPALNIAMNAGAQSRIAGSEPASYTWVVTTNGPGNETAVCILAWRVMELPSTVSMGQHDSTVEPDLTAVHAVIAAEANAIVERLTLGAFIHCADIGTIVSFTPPTDYTVRATEVHNIFAGQLGFYVTTSLVTGAYPEDTGTGTGSSSAGANNQYIAGFRLRSNSGTVPRPSGTGLLLKLLKMDNPALPYQLHTRML